MCENYNDQKQATCDYLKKDPPFLILGGLGTAFLGFGITGTMVGLNWKNNIENQLEHPVDAFIIGGEVFLAVGAFLLLLALIHAGFVYKHLGEKPSVHGRDGEDQLEHLNNSN